MSVSPPLLQNPFSEKVKSVGVAQFIPRSWHANDVLVRSRSILIGTGICICFERETSFSNVRRWSCFFVAIKADIGEGIRANSMNGRMIEVTVEDSLIPDDCLGRIIFSFGIQMFRVGTNKNDASSVTFRQLSTAILILRACVGPSRIPSY